MRNCVFVNIGTSIPLALGILEAVIMREPELQNALHCELLSFRVAEDNLEIVKNIIKNSSQDPIICLSLYIWNYTKTLELCKLIKEKLPKSTIIVGGPIPTPIPAEILNNHTAVDIVVVGEAEITFVELVKHILEVNTDFASIKGIAFRKNGKVVQTSPRELIQDLDIVPSPYARGLKPIVAGASQFSSYRGCVYNCGYCLWPYGGSHKIRSYSYERIEQEFRTMIDISPKIFCTEAIFNINKERLRKMAEIVQRIGRKDLELFVNLKGDLIDTETIPYLKQCNVKRAEVGLQTTNPETLKNINRQLDEEKFIRGVKLLREAGIRYTIDVIIGLPGDTFQTFKKTLDFALDLKPSWTGTDVLRVLPGTYIYDNAKKFEIEFDKEKEYQVIKNYSFSEQEITLAHRYSKMVWSKFRPRNNKFSWWVQNG